MNQHSVISLNRLPLVERYISGTDEICEHVLDRDDPETWGGEGGDECYVEEEVLNEDSMWTCPHDAEEGEDLCVFHLPVEEKDGGETVNVFLNTVDESVSNNKSGIEERKLQFVGARFGEFDLSASETDRLSELAGIKRARFVMSHAQMNGRFEWSGDVPQISFHGATFEHNAIFESAENAWSRYQPIQYQPTNPQPFTPGRIY